MNILIKLINDVKALCNTIITAVNAIKAKTDTITEDLFTATHASRLDATISSRQASWGATATHWKSGYDIANSVIGIQGLKAIISPPNVYLSFQNLH